ncbi:hypothetical protein DL764_000588 [Monosporascus ibericus]|uniref:Major facilitator superfamily (MFS) profile domain-containing protein n=1 Tax=Monosporascus ibericus TaxID=155417 RepID=A0A4Q4TSV2_9PEZI|nr:hypothetical protein DL764_000588 [Monosporascus ibericus]
MHKITDEFDSLGDVGWYGSAYLLTTAGLQLQFGKFYTFLNIKWVFLTAIYLFELGISVCGVSQNSVTLTVGHAIAGVGSAGMFSGGLLILAKSLPLAKRPIYIGFISSLYGIASVAGPLLGGVFTDKATWRWCFYINLPIGPITVVGITFFFSSPKQTITRKQEAILARINRFDPIGSVVFIPAIVCLLLALQWGGTTYPWNDTRIIVLTWQPETGSPSWIGYQVLFGAGFGMGLQQPMVAVQMVLEIADIPIGAALVTFLQSLGGALFVSVGQTVFGNELVKTLTKEVPQVDSQLVVAAGATSFRSVVPPDVLPDVVLSYNEALMKTFLVSARAAAATIFGSATVEWRSVKGKKS